MAKEKEKSEIDQLMEAVEIYSKPKYARKELGWSKSKFKKVVKDYHFPLNYSQLKSAVASKTAERILSQEITQFIKKAVPDDFNDMHQRSKEYADNNDLIGDIVKIKSNIINAGFTVLSKDNNEQKKINDFNDKHKIKMVVNQLSRYATIHDNILLNWKPDEKGAEYVEALDPAYFDVIPKYVKKDNNLVRDMENGGMKKEVYYKQDNSLKARISLLKTGKEIKRITSIKSLPKWNEWDEEQLGRVELRTHNGFVNEMVKPLMVQVMPDLALRQLIRDGNYAVFYFLKRMIHLIKVGAIKGDANVPTFLRSLTTLTRDKADSILAKFKNIDQAVRFVVPADQEHEFVAPDIEYLELGRFQAVDFPIIRWSDIAPLLGGTRETGQNYSEGYLGLKKAIPMVRNWRELIDDIIKTMYRECLNVKSEIEILWNEYILIEPKALLDRVKYLAQEQGLSPQTAQRILGFNPDLEQKQLEEARKNPEKWFPIFESRQGILHDYYIQKGILAGGEETDGDGEPGRPKEKDDDGQPQEPRPSTATMVMELGWDTIEIPKSIWTEKLWDWEKLEPAMAPKETEGFYHIETTIKHTWKKDGEYKSKKLKNGIVIRLFPTDEGKMAVRIWLIPKDMVDSLKEATKWVEKHEN